MTQGIDGHVYFASLLALVAVICIPLVLIVGIYDASSKSSEVTEVSITEPPVKYWRTN